MSLQSRYFPVVKMKVEVTRPFDGDGDGEAWNLVLSRYGAVLAEWVHPSYEAACKQYSEVETMLTILDAVEGMKRSSQ